MTRLERITIRPEGGRARTRDYEVQADGPSLLVLAPVDAEGARLAHYDGAVLVEHVELVSTSLVLRRVPLRVNPTYGTVEVADECLMTDGTHERPRADSDLCAACERIREAL